MDTYSHSWITEQLRIAEFMCNDYYPPKYPKHPLEFYHWWMARRRWLLRQLLRIQLRDFNHM